MAGGAPAARLRRRAAPPPLDEFDWLDRQLGALGWGPGECDGLELWRVARILGLRTDGKTDDPVIRGSRGLSLKSDDKPSAGGRSRSGPYQDPRLADRIAAGRRREERERAAAAAAADDNVEPEEETEWP